MGETTGIGSRVTARDDFPRLAALAGAVDAEYEVLGNADELAVEASRALNDLEVRELVRRVVMDFDDVWHDGSERETPCACSMAALGRWARARGWAE